LLLVGVMTAATTRASRLLALREKWDRLRHSDAVEDLLAEFLLWTAVWIGFPLSKVDLDGLHRSGRR
jgi:hypothetical protein